MQEKTINKISMVIVVLGLIFLFFYAEEVKLGKIETIEDIPAQVKKDIRFVFVSNYDEVLEVVLKRKPVSSRSLKSVKFRQSSPFLVA